MKVFDVISTLILLILLGVAIYFLYLNLPSEPIKLTNIISPITDNQIILQNKEIQFYPNMRYSESRISYEIAGACSNEKVSQVEEVFSILEDRTILEFYSSGNGEIAVTCSDLAPEPKTEGHFVAGEGGPTEIVNSTLYSVILSGKVALYRDEKCANPNIALHEILHALGFDHNNNQNSILYPTLDCDQEIDSYIIDEINRLYEVESAPDLTISKVEATKGGPYLNFEIEVANQGLKLANNVVLSIYSNGNLEEEFNLDDIDIGTRKILKVENLKISRSANIIKFVVDSQNRIDEISENNNELELVVEG